MELKELSTKTLELFGADSIDELGVKLLSVCKTNDIGKFASFADMVQDLSVDWLQMIYQYYMADRKGKKQDYTPKSLAQFCGLLIGDDNDVTDLCAGSGAMTIQKWNMSPDTTFTIYEIDENVIPFLIFNMMLRNINCTIYWTDVLQDEIYGIYKVDKGDRFGIYKEVAHCRV